MFILSSFIRIFLSGLVACRGVLCLSGYIITWFNHVVNWQRRTKLNHVFWALCTWYNHEQYNIIKLSYQLTREVIRWHLLTRNGEQTINTSGKTWRRLGARCGKTTRKSLKRLARRMERRRTPSLKLRQINSWRYTAARQTNNNGPGCEEHPGLFLWHRMAHGSVIT